MIVIDASVVLAWVLEDSDERHRYAAAAAEAGWTGQRRLIAPSVIQGECAYTLLKRGRAQRLGVKIREYAETISMFQFELVENRRSLAEIVGYAMLRNVQGYDAFYLELAEQTGAELATLDRGLRNAAITAGVKVFDPA